MSVRQLRQQANLIETQIHRHQHQARQQAGRLLDEVRKINPLFAPLAGLMSGAALAFVPIRSAGRQLRRFSALGWTGLRWLMAQVT